MLVWRSYEDVIGLLQGSDDILNWERMRCGLYSGWQLQQYLVPGERHCLPNLRKASIWSGPSPFVESSTYTSLLSLIGCDAGFWLLNSQFASRNQQELNCVR